jgi:hypothetical protein
VGQDFAVPLRRPQPRQGHRQISEHVQNWQPAEE